MPQMLSVRKKLRLARSAAEANMHSRACTPSTRQFLLTSRLHPILHLVLPIGAVSRQCPPLATGRRLEPGRAAD
eukprot:6181569-Pleurochrysis_carterae.AAC.9